MRSLLLITPAFLLLTACVSVDTTTSPRVIVDWDVTELAPGAYDQPNINIALTLSGAVNDRIDLGTYAGSFMDGRELSSRQETGSLLVGLTWWAGGGEELRVNQEGSSLVVIQRGVDEESGNGEFTTRKIVPIPNNAHIIVAPWRDQ